MNNKNFILLDVMKTGYHERFRNFINCNSIHNEIFDISHEYYDVNLLTTKNYQRKLAIIDVLPSTQKYFQNFEYITDLKQRLHNLSNVVLYLMFVFNINLLVIFQSNDVP